MIKVRVQVKTPSSAKSPSKLIPNEIQKKGLVFKPAPSRPEWRLTANGRKWIEENVLVKLREKEVMP